MVMGICLRVNSGVQILLFGAVSVISLRLAVSDWIADANVIMFQKVHQHDIRLDHSVTKRYKLAENISYQLSMSNCLEIAVLYSCRFFNTVTPISIFIIGLRIVMTFALNNKDQSIYISGMHRYPERCSI